MKLENQVVSLELAKKLKELGVKQESQFMWWKGAGEGYLRPTDWSQFNMEPKPMYSTADLRERFSAFTVAELGEMLSTTENNNQIRDTKVFTQWGCDYETHRTLAPTEADVRAKMLIYLLENKLI